MCQLAAQPRAPALDTFAVRSEARPESAGDSYSLVKVEPKPVYEGHLSDRVNEPEQDIGQAAIDSMDVASDTADVLHIDADALDYRSNSPAEEEKDLDEDRHDDNQGTSFSAAPNLLQLCGVSG